MAEGGESKLPVVCYLSLRSPQPPSYLPHSSRFLFSPIHLIWSISDPLLFASKKSPWLLHLPQPCLWARDSRLWRRPCSTYPLICVKLRHFIALYQY